MGDGKEKGRRLERGQERQTKEEGRHTLGETEKKERQTTER
jgi:hypothetical protein